MASVRIGSRKRHVPDPRKPKGYKFKGSVEAKLKATFDLHPDLLEFFGTDNPRSMHTFVDDGLTIPPNARLGTMSDGL